MKYIKELERDHTMKEKIDKNSKIPLYIQLADIFIENIEKNMNENDKLDTEREISKQYSLSRVTVRPVSYTHLTLPTILLV